jgi:rhamnulokinase
LGLTNEGGVAGSILTLRNLTGLWILQECMRKWEREGRSSSWEDIISASAAAPELVALIDPDAKEFRMPSDMPKAIQDYCRATGQRPPATVGEIARCAFESLSLKYRSVLQSLEQITGRRLQTIRIVGGGSLNRLLCQMVADCCGRLVVAGPAEASALGNVMLQAVATGHLSGVAEGRAAIAASIQCASFEPNPSDAWDEAFFHFERLVTAGKVGVN